MFDILFNEIAVVIVTAGVISLIAFVLRQPLIIAYIITGLLVGPSVLHFTRSPEIFEAMSEIGIAFLLFVVGLGLNWRNIRDVGSVAAVAGFGQVLFTSAIGVLLGIGFNMEPIPAILLAVAFAFSSTIIIVKLLTDKEDIDRFYGRIAIGMLIVQDLLAMIALLVMTAVGRGDSFESLMVFVTLKTGIVVAVLWLVARYILPHVFKFAARSQELLFLTALSWCFALASGLHMLGFSIEIGALLAGISLAGLEFHREIEGKIRPLRDFFLIIFFIVLGTQLSIDAFSAVLPQALMYSAFILIGNPLIVILILRAMGYHPRTGFLVGVTMAQISEFSFIMLASAVGIGLLSEALMPMITLVAMITIAVSTYLIKYNERLYQFLEPIFRPLEKGLVERKVPRQTYVPITMFGFDDLGKQVLPAVKGLKSAFRIVDFDPRRVQELHGHNIPALYGDAGSEDFLSSIHIHKSKLVISTVLDMAVNTDLIMFLKAKRSRAPIIVSAKNVEQARQLYDIGATFVIVPKVLGGELFADILQKRKFKKTNWGPVMRRQKRLLGLR